MKVTVYKDTTELFTQEEIAIDNVVDLEFPDEIVRGYFNEYILDSFRTDESISTDAFFEDWLEEYTADDTIDLVDYARVKGFEVERS